MLSNIFFQYFKYFGSIVLKFSIETKTNNTGQFKIKDGIHIMAPDIVINEYLQLDNIDLKIYNASLSGKSLKK